MNAKHFKATDFLASLYGGGPMASNTVAVNAGRPDLTEQMKTHKRELLAVLDSDLAASVSDSDPREQCIELPAPCPECGGLMYWWNLLGQNRCMACDPPETAMRALETVEKIRRQHGIRSPPGVTEMLATLKRSSDT